MVSEKYNIAGVTSYTVYDTGELKDCKVNELNEIKVKDNILVPRYEELNERFSQLYIKQTKPEDRTYVHSHISGSSKLQSSRPHLFILEVHLSHFLFPVFFPADGQDRRSWKNLFGLEQVWRAK